MINTNLWLKSSVAAQALLAEQAAKDETLNLLEYSLPSIGEDSARSVLTRYSQIELDIIEDTNTTRVHNHIKYSFHPFLDCELLLASTSKGLVALYFSFNREESLVELSGRLKAVAYSLEQVREHQLLMAYLNGIDEGLPGVQLHMIGTPFQIVVWKALLSVEPGQVKSYKDIASWIGNPKAQQAVGTALGKNNISIIVPCHRVINSDGKLGGYHWGVEKKLTLLIAENAKYE